MYKTLGLLTLQLSFIAATTAQAKIISKNKVEVFAEGIHKLTAVQLCMGEQPSRKFV